MSSVREEIVQLLYTYAERIDEGDFEGVAAMFEEAQITTERNDERRRGRAEVLDMYVGSTRRYPDGTPKTKHVTTNVIVEADEEAGLATARSYFTVLQAVPDELALQPIIAGRYRDRFERVNGVWRFAARHMIVDLVGDLSRHLLFELR